MKERRLLVLNGSHSEVPLIRSAKSLGFYVITTGDSPDLIGHQYSDEYHCMDYSDYESVLTLARKLKIDVICSCANDFGAITAAYVSERLELPGHDSFEVATLLHHKDSFKQFASKHNIPTPKSKCYDDLDMALAGVEQVIFPSIVKPVDMTGGKGVTKILSRTDYESSVIRAFECSRQKRVVVEEFFIGTLHSLSSFLVDHKVEFYFSDNEFSTVNPYAVASSASPAVDVERYAPDLVKAIESIAKALDLVDGVFHIQYIADGREAKIIDITRRCSGDLYPYPVSYSTHIDWASWIIRAETGEDCTSFPEITQSGYFGRHCVMADRNGTVRDVVICDSIRPYICDSLFWWQKGDVIANFQLEKLGVVFLDFGREKGMLELVGELQGLIRVELE